MVEHRAGHAQSTMSSFVSESRPSDMGIRLVAFGRTSKTQDIIIMSIIIIMRK